ncbi:MAG: hypothetical protein ACD_60C00160G0005 [uncultured bacterium]|nr:MAG: hypothetical protein ACD_60C00160G0005 [uncultured bacterium]
MNTATIAILGAGNMGTSLLSGLIATGLSPAKLWVTDPDLQKLHALQQQFNVQITQANEEAAKKADVIIFAVKPQIIANVAKSLSHIVQKQKPLIISIAAGIPEKSLEQWLGNQAAIVRTMPNTPALISAGATALHANNNVSSTQHNLAESILRAVGITVWLPKEKDMDAVTALSGSGPAYFFLVIEALQKAGQKLGLPEETARLLTLQTALGAARMALESNLSVAELRERVTSKGGTTEAALAVFEKGHIRDLFTEALHAAKTRSEELSRTML